MQVKYNKVSKFRIYYHIIIDIIHGTFYLIGLEVFGVIPAYTYYVNSVTKLK